MKWFGPKNAISQQLHKIVVQNEKNISILKGALKYYHHQATFDKIFKAAKQEFWINLNQVIYQQSLPALVEIKIEEEFLDLADEISRTYFTKASNPIFELLGNVLNSKISIVREKPIESLEYLHNALLKYPVKETFLALHALEKLLIPIPTKSSYESKEIKIPTPIYTEKLNNSRLIKMVRKVEKGIQDFIDPLDKVMTYIDLSIATGHYLLMANWR